MAVFWAHNGAPATAAAAVKVATGTSIKTLLQVATPSTQDISVVEWGISFDGSAAATPIECELIVVGQAATVTSFTPQLYTADAHAASACVGGTSATGYTSTGEGTISGTTFYGDLQLIAPTSQYVKQWPLGREFYVPVSSFLRVRVTAGTTVNAYCYIIWVE